MESLFKMSKDGTVKPLLVKSTHQKSDNTLELTLKDNIKFQNGHKVTGNAVKSSLEEGMKKSDLLKGHYLLNQFLLKVKSDDYYRRTLSRIKIRTS